MVDQIQKLSYCASTFFITPIIEQAGRAMIDTTDGEMTRAYIVGSGQCHICISPCDRAELTPSRFRSHGSSNGKLQSGVFPQESTAEMMRFAGCVLAC